MELKQIPANAIGEDTARVLESVANESDRGCALIVGAWLDEVVRELVASRLSPESDLKALFNGPSAPSGSFSSRILVAHCLGLIEKSEQQSLNGIHSPAHVG
jgi:hypothetical protein